jgi:hypothetical protein
METSGLFFFMVITLKARKIVNHIGKQDSKKEGWVHHGYFLLDFSNMSHISFVTSSR